MNSRRDFLAKASGFVAASSLGGAAVPKVLAAASPSGDLAGHYQDRFSLDGVWQFRLDPEKAGENNKLFAPETPTDGWNEVLVPHTWQVLEQSADYYGVSWYRRAFETPREWSDKVVRIEFEGVFHSASVWVNGRPVGQHLRKGYTAFTFDIEPLLNYGKENVIVVRVNNEFDPAMLPRGRSSDWTHDGGIYRPVNLSVTPRVFIERVDVDAVPNLDTNTAQLDVTVVVRNSGTKPWKGQVGYTVAEERTGLTVLSNPNSASASVQPGQTATLRVPAVTLQNPRLWHFDHPNLYALRVQISGKPAGHQFSTTFGVRSFEVKKGTFYLNGERVRLMGVERMGGSHPAYGMAEPSSWIQHDHDDLKLLNCVFTRVHWPQDKRVLEYCDRHGILIQTEVPAWGPDTFKDMKDEPSPDIMQSGLEQLRAMIERDRNHPCLFAWGLCNEIDGQNPPASKFAARLYQEAKKLDPRRLCSYASNSLQDKPSADVSELMDFVEWNEYYESWYGGSPDDLRTHLQQIHQAFPGKPIVISEYGYCACTPERPEGDARRIEVLRDHTRVCRETDYVGGLIFFCYNDYRTHQGDRGTGVLKQRIHGVVDLLGAKKGSYEVLRTEASPVESVTVEGSPSSLMVGVRTRSSAPSYVLKGYLLRAMLHGYSDIPLECHDVALPVLSPGRETLVPIRFKESGAVRITFDIVRPTGFSCFTQVWTP